MVVTVALAASSEVGEKDGRRPSGLVACVRSCWELGSAECLGHRIAGGLIYPSESIRRSSRRPSRAISSGSRSVLVAAARRLQGTPIAWRHRSGSDARRPAAIELCRRMRVLSSTATSPSSRSSWRRNATSLSRSACWQRASRDRSSAVSATSALTHFQKPAGGSRQPKLPMQVHGWPGGCSPPEGPPDRPHPSGSSGRITPAADDRLGRMRSRALDDRRECNATNAVAGSPPARTSAMATRSPSTWTRRACCLHPQASAGR